MPFSTGRTLTWLSLSVSALSVGAIAAGSRSALLVMVIVLHGAVAAAGCLLGWQKQERLPADPNCRTFWRRRRRLCPDEFPSRRFTLRYDKGSVDAGQASNLVWLCEETIDELARWHGGLLVSPPTVFVLANNQQFRQMFGPRCGAICIGEKKAVVVPAYGVPGRGYVDEVVRHEIAHLFTAQWNRRAIPLLNEGFASWWERAGGQPAIDHPVARVDLTCSLVNLLDPSFFFNRRCATANYAVAGSFSGFLIRRFGRERYRDFYRQATRENFGWCVAECFGATLGEVEARWRIETTAAPDRKGNRYSEGL